MCLFHVAGSKRELVCRCNTTRCQSMNYTCITEGACVVYIGTDATQTRSCTTEHPAPRMICDSHDGKPNDRLDNHGTHAHCCYQDMCNDVTKINLTLPTVKPSTSPTGKGNFTGIGLIYFLYRVESYFWLCKHLYMYYQV